MRRNIDTSITQVNRCVYLTGNKVAYNLAVMNYGERLKAARKFARLTQAALAEAVGMSQPTISHLEDPQNNCTGSEFTARLARICKVNVDWLDDEIGEMLPNCYYTTDPKIIAAAKIMEPMSEYAKDAAVKDVAEIAELIARAKGDGTNG